MRLAVAAALLLAWGCASAGDPPGGPPDREPPKIVAMTPDSGAVDSVPPKAFTIAFDEVISERAATPKGDLAGAFLVSPLDPDTVPPKVEWHRDHVTIVPKHGFQPGRVYRIELLPAIVDLRTNKMRVGRVIVFSTGPAIPTAALAGTLVDWVGNRPAAQGIVEAVDLRDSLTYRALSDSVGNFRLEQIPPGDYLVYGTVDQNNDRRRGAREAFDSTRVTLADTARAQLYAFVHDTTGPRLRRVESVDSITLRLTFTAPLDPATALDTHLVRIAPYTDSTAQQGVQAVLTQKELDTLKAQEQAARNAERAARDTTRRAPVDTTRRAPVDTTRRAQPARADTTRRGPPAQARDSTRAQKMLARRPPPTDIRFVRLFTPTTPGERYYVCVDSARSISLLVGDLKCNQVAVPRPTPVRRDTTRGRDTTRLDSTRIDSTRADTTRRDTTRAPRDTTRARRDTTSLERLLLR